MKNFIYKSIVFSLPLIGFIVFLEISLRSIPNSYELKKSYLDDNSEFIQVLILGSSHASMGVVPDCFDAKAYNAAMTSQSLEIDYEILKNYETRLKNLVSVILPIDYFSLTSSLKNSVESWRVKDYIMYYDLPIKSSLKHESEVLSHSLKHNLKRFRNYYIDKKSEIYYTDDGNEIFKEDHQVFDLATSGIRAADRHTTSSYDNYRENLKILSMIVSMCQKNNWHLLLYTSPGHETYYNLLDSIQLALTITSVDSLAGIYKNCEYFNFLKDTSYHSSDFYDGDHLNEYGARKLSKKLNELF